MLATSPVLPRDRTQVDENESLTFLEMKSLAYVGRDLTVNSNPLLTTVETESLTTVYGDLIVDYNPELGYLELDSLDSVGKNFVVSCPRPAADIACHLHCVRETKEDKLIRSCSSSRTRCIITTRTHSDAPSASSHTTAMRGASATQSRRGPTHFDGSGCTLSC